MNRYQSHDTIVAQCTPQGPGALALIRVSGKDAISIVDKISTLASKNKLSNLSSHTIHYGVINSINNQTIDTVLFLLMRGPHTFTGEDTVEITSHNNQFIINDIISLLINAGARLAHNGEFSKWAVLNNKMDLIQAESINEVIHANSQQALKSALAQMQGSFSHTITAIEKKLITALALSDASFEFIDEENMEFSNQINITIQNTLATIQELKTRYDQQQQIREGVRIALIGSVNAGKSSLFNLLLDKQRAIVTPIAGTTRDVIEAGIYRNGSYWTMIDTAGLRHTDDYIEKEGIRRSHEEAQKADIIIMVIDGARTMTQQEKEVYHDLYLTHPQKTIIICTKQDLPPVAIPFLQDKEFHSISTHDLQAKTIIQELISHKIEHLFNQLDSPYLLNIRQYTLLLHLEIALKNASIIASHKDVAYELLSFELKEAIASLSELTGKTISEAGMDAVFREFCVGK